MLERKYNLPHGYALMCVYLYVYDGEMCTFMINVINIILYINIAMYNTY